MRSMLNRKYWHSHQIEPITCRCSGSASMMIFVVLRRDSIGLKDHFKARRDQLLIASVLSLCLERRIQPLRWIIRQPWIRESIQESWCYSTCATNCSVRTNLHSDSCRALWRAFPSLVTIFFPVISGSGCILEGRRARLSGQLNGGSQITSERFSLFYSRYTKTPFFLSTVK